MTVELDQSIQIDEAKVQSESLQELLLKKKDKSDEICDIMEEIEKGRYELKGKLTQLREER
jgi:hypothetical protein